LAGRSVARGVGLLDECALPRQRIDEQVARDDAGREIVIDRRVDQEGRVVATQAVAHPVAMAPPSPVYRVEDAGVHHRRSAGERARATALAAERPQQHVVPVEDGVGRGRREGGPRQREQRADDRQRGHQDQSHQSTFHVDTSPVRIEPGVGADSGHRRRPSGPRQRRASGRRVAAGQGLG
jgi:hypothetical protein